MSRSTFSVLFYANKSKVKNGIVPVMGRITINGTQSQFSCKRSIPLSLWDAKGNCAKGRTRDALDLNRDLDKKLKPVMKECGIDKPISAHCARHGFATMALTKGMPIESISRVLGHTNIVTTQIYARITTHKLDNDLTMLGNKLNASFNNIKLA